MQVPGEVEFYGVLSVGEKYLFDEEGRQAGRRQSILGALFEGLPTIYQLFTLDNRQGVMIEVVDDFFSYNLMQEQLDPLYANMIFLGPVNRDRGRLADVLKEVFYVDGEVEKKNLEDALERLDPRAKAFRIGIKSFGEGFEVSVLEKL